MKSEMEQLKEVSLMVKRKILMGVGFMFVGCIASAFLITYARNSLASQPSGEALLAAAEKERVQVIGQVDDCKVVRIYEFAERRYALVCKANTSAVPLPPENVR